MAMNQQKSAILRLFLAFLGALAAIIAAIACAVFAASLFADNLRASFTLRGGMVLLPLLAAGLAWLSRRRPGRTWVAAGVLALAWWVLAWGVLIVGWVLGDFPALQWSDVLISLVPAAFCWALGGWLNLRFRT